MVLGLKGSGPSIPRLEGDLESSRVGGVLGQKIHQSSAELKSGG